MSYKKVVSVLLLFVTLILFSFNVSATNMPEISSGAAILIENSTSETLFKKNSNEHLEPASITKILTAILTIENTNLNDIVTVPEAAVSSIPPGYSVAALLPNEQLTVEQLLKVLMVHSANDAANVLAFHIDGSIENFASRMNAKMDELGLKDSHFTNPSGMHDVNHYSSAHDIAFLMQYCVKNPTFRKYSGLKSCKIPATNLSGERNFTNTNSMLIETGSNNQYYYPYITCTKTGFTSQAKYCLVSYASKDNMDCICVVLAAETSELRFADTKNLFEYGFSNFSFKDIAVKGDVITQVTVSNGTEDTKNLDLVLADNLRVLTNNNLSADSISPQILLDNIPSAPIALNKVLGTATYVINDKSYSVDLIASHNVEVSTSRTYFIQIALLVLVVVILFILLFWNKGKKKKENIYKII